MLGVSAALSCAFTSQLQSVDKTESTVEHKKKPEGIRETAYPK